MHHIKLVSVRTIIHTTLVFFLVLFHCASSCWGRFLSPQTATYQAAALISQGLSEYKHSGWYGTSKATQGDVYTHLAGGQFKTYRPEVFEALRLDTGVEEKVLHELLRPNNLESMTADSKSGQTFWQTADGTLVLKTIKQYECKHLRSVLDHYASHVIGHYTCIAGILGLYRVKFRSGKKVYLLLSKNVYHRDCSSMWDHNTHRKYDLKGSTIGRRKTLRSSVRKDLDFIHDGRKLQLGQRVKSAVMLTLVRDTQFLSKHKFMDYSLLVDIVQPPPPLGVLRKVTARLIGGVPISKSLCDRGKLVAVGSDGYLYQFGIVDFLQKYSFRKWFETLLKGLWWDKMQISCVNSNLYARRFVKFLEEYSV